MLAHARPHQTAPASQLVRSGVLPRNGHEPRAGRWAVRLLERRRTTMGDGQAEGAGDAALVAGAQADPLAFDRLFDRYGSPVLNYCYYRLGTWEEAEDAA